MKFGNSDDDFDNGQHNTYRNKNSRPLLYELTSNSSFKTGCCVIGAVVFYLISHYGGPLISTLLFTVVGVVYIYVEKFNSANTVKNRFANDENSENLVASLRRENEKYRQERDHTLEKLSPLKALKKDNENLKSQIERQTHTTDQLLDEIARLKIEQKIHQCEKLGYADDLLAEKQRSRRELEASERKSEETILRFRQEIQQINEEKLKQEMKIAELLDNLRLAKNERQWFENEARNAIQKEQQLVEQYKQALETTQRKCQETDADLDKFKKMLSKSEDNLQRVQQTTLKTLEKSRNEVNELKAENANLKSFHRTTEPEGQAPVCNICEDRPRDCYIDPCGHTLCMVCATEVQSRNRKCPVCRKYINKLGQLFFN